MDSDNITATFRKFSVKFANEAGTPDLQVQSKEDFFIFACRHAFSDARVAQATSSWLFYHLSSLRLDLVVDLAKKESKTTQIFAQAVLDQISNLKGISILQRIGAVLLAKRFAPFGELGDLGNKYFSVYNVSMAGFPPDPKKFLKSI